MTGSGSFCYNVCLLCCFCQHVVNLRTILSITVKSRVAQNANKMNSERKPCFWNQWSISGPVKTTKDRGFDGSTGEIEGLGKKKGEDICEIWGGGGGSGAELETWGPLPLGAKNKRDVSITSSIFLQPEVITLLTEHTHTPMDCIHTLWHLNECAHVQHKHMSFVSCQRVECLMSNINYSDGSTHAALRGWKTHMITHIVCVLRDMNVTWFVY